MTQPREGLSEMPDQAQYREAFANYARKQEQAAKRAALMKADRVAWFRRRKAV